MRILIIVVSFLFHCTASRAQRDSTAVGNEGIMFTAIEKQGSLPSLFAERAGSLFSFANKGDTLLENKSLGLSIYFPKGFRIEILEPWTRRQIASSTLSLKSFTIIKTIYFDFNSELIRNDASAELDKLAALMIRYSFAQVTVFVHTDSRGSPVYNKKLAGKRGDAIIKYLKGTGADLSKFIVNISGEEELANDCHDQVDCDEIAHQLNRRAEFIFNPRTP